MKNKQLSILLRIFRDRIKEINSHTDKDSFNNSQRRNFIKQSLVASLSIGGLSSSLLNSCSVDKSKSDLPKIAIVGGGIAGLHAGHILAKNGIGFALFESSDRVGGRINTAKNIFGENTYTELGGEFIDSNHTDMINLVNEFGLKLYDTEADINQSKLIKDTFYFSGKHISEKEIINEFSKYAELISEDVKKVVEEEDEEVTNYLDSLSINQYLNKIGIDNWLFELIANAYTSEYGMESSEQSSLNLIYMLNPDTSTGFKIFGESDERYKIEGGNSLLIEKMYNELKSSIQLNHQLSSISEKEGSYTLTFSNNQKFDFEYVIMAIPFSVLRGVKLDIQLPTEKKKAIAELGYGTSSKIILGVNERTWRNLGYSGYLFSNEIQNGWDSSLGQNNNKGQGSYTIFLGGNLGKSANKSDVEKYQNAFSSIFKSDEPILNSSSQVLNWFNNPNSLGGYSSYKVGQWTSIAGYEKEPVNNLFFAGEHCSEDFQGYMNGGAETGRFAAEAVIKKIKIK